MLTYLGHASALHVRLVCTNGCMGTSLHRIVRINNSISDRELEVMRNISFRILVGSSPVLDGYYGGDYP